MSTFAGTGTSGYSGDGQTAFFATFTHPISLDVIPSTGDVYIGDIGTHRIRMVDGSTGVITTIAGTGEAGFSGDGGLAVNAKINLPRLCVNTITGDIYFSDINYHRVRKITFYSGIITTIAGTGIAGYYCDNCPALYSNLNQPFGISYNSITEDLYISDEHNHRIRKVNSNGIITTVAGTGIAVISLHKKFVFFN